MQKRSSLDNDFNGLKVSDESNEDLFNQSIYKLNICGQTHSYSPKLVNNKSTLNVSSLQGNTSAVNPTILRITPNINALIGETVCLRVQFTTNSLLANISIVWSKNGKQLEESKRIEIKNEEQMSTLLIKRVMDCDNGKYEIEVKDQFGSDRAHTSLAVKGPPEPPGQPSVVISKNCAQISWPSTPYDGGSRVLGYKIDMQIDENDWMTLTNECIVNPFSLKDIEINANSVYIFRVFALNQYGMSEPSEDLKYVCNQMNNSENVCEERNVVIEKDVNFNEIYEIKEVVGRGRFGVCKRVIELSTNKEKAAKIIRCLRAKDREQVYREVDIMNSLRHKHILQLESAYEFTKEIILITEYISGGELFERIVADDYILTEYECILFVRQICEAVSYMHSNNIMHLDLKPENILCKTRTSYEIKIIDFGLARTHSIHQTLKIMFGTPEFVAPEIVNYEAVTPASDMWSVGVICYVLLSGLSPFMDETDAKTLCNVTQADYDFDDEAFESISEEAKQFISSLLVKNPDKRLSADQCLANSWLKREPSKHIPIPTEKLKKFLIRRKWQKTGTAIRAMGRIANLGLRSHQNRQNFVSEDNNHFSHH